MAAATVGADGVGVAVGVALDAIGVGEATPDGDAPSAFAVADAGAAVDDA